MNSLAQEFFVYYFNTTLTLSGSIGNIFKMNEVRNIFRFPSTTSKFLFISCTFSSLSTAKTLSFKPFALWTKYLKMKSSYNGLALYLLLSKITDPCFYKESICVKHIWSEDYRIEKWWLCGSKISDLHVCVSDIDAFLFLFQKGNFQFFHNKI